MKTKKRHLENNEKPIYEIVEQEFLQHYTFKLLLGVPHQQRKGISKACWSRRPTGAKNFD